MTDETTAVLDNDPLNQTVGDTNTDFPLLAPGLYDMEIRKPSVGPSKSTPGAQTFTIPLVTTADAADIKGDVLRSGFPITHRIGITETPDYPIAKVIKNVAIVAKAAGLPATTKVGDVIRDPSCLDGKVVRVKVKINKATAEFGESNGVTFITA
jgi:hypothetical protein